MRSCPALSCSIREWDEAVRSDVEHTGDAADGLGCRVVAQHDLFAGDRIIGNDALTVGSNLCRQQPVRRLSAAADHDRATLEQWPKIRGPRSDWEPCIARRIDHVSSAVRERHLAREVAGDVPSPTRSDDLTQDGVRDLWASPLMTFASGAGDCEDYAIVKYVALREIGVGDEDLRLDIVHDHAANEDHAVTAVRYDRRWLILDNKTLDIRQDDSIAQFNPLFVIDSDGVKRVEARTPKPQNPWTDANIMTSEPQAARRCCCKARAKHGLERRGDQIRAIGEKATTG